MHDDELWQVYNDNGTPIPGKGVSKEEFNTNKDLKDDIDSRSIYDYITH